MAPKTRLNGDAGSSEKPQTPSNTKGSKKAPKKAPQKAPQKKEYTKLPQPSNEDGVATDPTAKNSYIKSKPTTEEEMQEWIEHQRNLCRAYLERCKSRAEDASTSDMKDSLELAMRTEWKKWEHLTNIETGEIYDETERTNMEESMRAAYQYSVQTYNTKDGNDDHHSYRKAQTIWEDFLYFQNQWNRIPSRDHDGQRASRTSTKAKTLWGKDYVNAETADWQKNMLSLYNTHRVGDRKRIPGSGIGPNQLHSIPDNIHHTANGKKRRDCLEDVFPTSDIRLDDGAIHKRHTEAENIRQENIRQENIRQENIRQENIRQENIRQENIRQENISQEKEREEESPSDQRKYAVGEELPENHQLYHAATESTALLPNTDRQAHTSWETNGWGSAVANKEQVPFNQKQKMKSTQPRWRTIEVPRLVRETRTVYERRRRLYVTAERIVWDKVFELDEDDARIGNEEAVDIYEKPAYQSTNTVTIAHKKNGQYSARREAYNTRRSSNKHPEKGADEMSVASDEDLEEDEETHTFGDDVPEQDTDLFYLSYHNRLDADGNIPGAKKPGSGGKGPKPPKTGEDGGDKDPDGSDDDSDDEKPKPNSGLPKTKPSRSKASKSKSAKAKSSQAKSSQAKSSKARSSAAKPSEYETFSTGKGKDEGFRIAECTHKFSEDVIITQCDRVPLQDDSAAEQFDDDEKLLCDVLPHDFRLSEERAQMYKDMTWGWNKAKGFFQLGDSDVTWRPVFVLRKFNKGTGKCEDSHDFVRHVQSLVDQSFSKESIISYNKAVAQWHDRNDADALSKAGKAQPRWTQEEHMQLLQALNQMAATHGLRWIRDHWKGKNGVGSQLRQLNDDYRENTLNLPARGPEALRGKMRRSKATKKKEDLTKASDELLDSHPSDFFTIGDIDRLEVQDEAGGEAEDEAEDEAEGVAKRAAGDELDETEQPAKKKRKL